jgi:PAS domain-containing protein
MAAELNDTRDKTRQSEERYRVIFNEADDAIVLFAGGRLLDGNAAAARLFGRPVDTLRGLPLVQLVTPDDPPADHASALRRAAPAAAEATVACALTVTSGRRSAGACGLQRPRAVGAGAAVPRRLLRTPLRARPSARGRRPR